MYIAKLDHGGRITIPAQIRRKLGLAAGDQVQFVEHGSGYLFSKCKRSSIMDLQGVGKWNGPPVSIEEMNETIEKGWAGLLESED